MKSINIKGKDYVMVNERVKAFRENKDWSAWSIVTTMTHYDETQCVFKCEIRDANGVVRSTGYAHEEKDASNINRTSYVENCETSAIGRALGILGIGIDAAICSAEEVVNAMTAQLDKKRPTAKAETISTDEMLAMQKEKAISELSNCDKVSQLEKIYRGLNGQLRADIDIINLCKDTKKSLTL